MRYFSIIIIYGLFYISIGCNSNNLDYCTSDTTELGANTYNVIKLFFAESPIVNELELKGIIGKKYNEIYKIINFPHIFIYSTDTIVSECKTVVLILSTQKPSKNETSNLWSILIKDGTIIEYLHSDGILLKQELHIQEIMREYMLSNKNINN